jgi:hypothetical protein
MLAADGDGPHAKQAILIFCLSKIFFENRILPRVKSEAGFFGIMLKNREAP